MGPAQIAAGVTRINGPSEGFVWVIRTIILVNDRAAAIPFRMGIGGTAEAQAISVGQTVAANNRRVIEERIYLRNGNGGLHVINNSGLHPMTITIFGAELPELD